MMKIKIIRLQSRLYLKVLTYMGIIGFFSMTSCKGSEKTSATDEITKPTTDEIAKPAKDSIAVTVKDTVVTYPANKYGIPVNFEPINNPNNVQPTKYGVQPVNEIEVKYGIPNNTY